MTAPIDDTVYAVTCDCGYFGMREDCRRGRCPNCQQRVKRERREDENKDDPMGGPVAVVEVSISVDGCGGTG
jgi:hypothetical protein